MDLQIKKILKNKGVSVTSLAKAIGITQPSLSSIIHGNVKPSMDTLKKIAGTLDIEMWELFAERKVGDLNAVIDYRGRSYVASSIDELEKIVFQLKELV